MNGINLEAIANMVLATLAASTQTAQAEMVDKLASEMAKLVRSTETTFDDALVKQLVVPNLDRLAQQLKAEFA